MSNASPNDKKRDNRSRRERKRSNQNQAQATTPNVEQSRQDMPYSYNEDFPSLHAATSKQATAPAANASSSNKVYFIL
jgi:hypothetical protein